MNFKNVLILSICGLISTNSFSESNWEVITKDNEGMYYEIRWCIKKYAEKKQIEF